MDQAQSRTNATVKGRRRCLGLRRTRSSSSLDGSGPEMARLIQEFEDQTRRAGNRWDVTMNRRRHAQMAFAQDGAITEPSHGRDGEPVRENTAVISLSCIQRDVVDTAVAAQCGRWRNFGLEHIPITRKTTSIFSARPPVTREVKEETVQMSSLKNDFRLFSRLYIASQIRHGDIDEVLSAQNQGPSTCLLSQMGA
ncbi:hypothetical protein GWK47_044972 [Chionoecetes opilio]|uniref:Uncharacterized protein n=1 Tax=Chionoecetes opilio TaxID=41210 RepID=A0A8J4Y7T2_CHIOP|nr:hypothetical protein GWK47_044972 [Chionoecetes opilio]